MANESIEETKEKRTPNRQRNRNQGKFQAKEHIDPEVGHRAQQYNENIYSPPHHTHHSLSQHNFLLIFV